MKLYNKYTENKFFIKMSFTYCLILIVSVLITAYFITSDTTKDLSQIQLKYENEVLQKIEQHTDSTFKEINKIINGLYINSHYNSIINLLSPYKKMSTTQEEKSKIISHTLQNICNANSIITDMIIVDKINQEIYFHSNQSDRDISIDYDFFKENESILNNATNNKKIISSHVPRYIMKNSITSNMPVTTIYVNLYDLDYIRDDKRIGVVAININPEILFQPFYKEMDELKGDIFILNGNDIMLSSNNKTLKEYETLQREDKNQYSNKILSQSTGLAFVNFINKDLINESVKKSRQKVVPVIVISILLGIIVSIMSSRVFTGRIKELVKHIKKIEKGGFDRSIIVHDNDEIGYLETSFNDMCKKLSDYVNRVYISNIRRKTAEVQALQAQINPHYMFNTLESIRMVALINKDNESANMINILGNMFRWNMRMKELVVTIEDELDYIEAYIELQKIRYDNGFQIAFNVHDSIKKYGVPKQILQPIVENALYHGGINNSRILTIDINIFMDEDIYFEIIDNGKGITQEALIRIRKSIDYEVSNDNLYSIGLQNVHQRVALLFGDHYGLQIDSGIGKGTKVVVRIPRMAREEMNRFVQSNDC